MHRAPSPINRPALAGIAALLRRWFAIFAAAWLLRGALHRAGIRRAEQRLSELIVALALARIQLPAQRRRQPRRPGRRFTRKRSALASYLRLALPHLRGEALPARAARCRHVFAKWRHYVSRLIKRMLSAPRITRFVTIAEPARLAPPVAAQLVVADTS